MRGEPEVHKKGLFASGRLRSVGILLSDLGFTRDGEPGFRSSAPPPDGAGRAGAQRRVPDGAGRTRLRAAPGSLPAREVLLLAPLHGSTHRSVLTFFFISRTKHMACCILCLGRTLRRFFCVHLQGKLRSFCALLRAVYFCAWK